MKTLLATPFLLSPSVDAQSFRVRSTLNTGSVDTNIYEVLNSKWTNVTLIDDWIAGATLKYNFFTSREIYNNGTDANFLIG